MHKTDVVAFGAHPDDIEIGCGGTLLKLTDLGHSVVLVDMVWGEMSTRGTLETRKIEAANAARIIGASDRKNLALEDADIHVSKQSKRKVVEVIRKYRPQLVMIPYFKDRHPDHYNTSKVVYEGLFLAGLDRFETGQQSYRPPQTIYYMQWYEFKPTFIVNITEQYERKMQAIYSYSSQFRPDDNFYKQTRLTSREYNWMITSRMSYYGSLIGRQYGEGFLINGHLEVEDPLDLHFSSF